MRTDNLWTALDPDRSLQREDVFTLMATAPERVSDLVSALDTPRLRYRHGPAFPTLEELLVHVVDTGIRLDGMLRHAYLDHSSELDLRRVLDAPLEPAATAESTEDLLSNYTRIRRRTVDLVRGLSQQELDRVLHDPRQGELTLLDACRLVVVHEIGHVAQIRNLISLLPEPQDLGPVAGGWT